MQKFVRPALLSGLLMLAIPSSVLIGHMENHGNVNVSESKIDEDTRYYNMLVTKSNSVERISVRDYLIGAVAAEMPADYAHEALCAQVIASHTYAERLHELHMTQPDDSLPDADFSDDSSRYQAYYTDADMRLLWGTQYEANRKKITDAVDAVGDLVLCYDNAPIVAAFHAISPGETESAENAWGTSLPYLVSVESEADRTAPQYETVCSFSPETLSASLLTAEPSMTFPADPSSWLGSCQYSDAGTVLSLEIAGTKLSGAAIRQALALRSPAFTAAYDAEQRQFVFTVRGYGHSVGMSQYGAHQMALAGASCEEILLHYYPGTELRKQ